MPAARSLTTAVNTASAARSVLTEAHTVWSNINHIKCTDVSQAVVLCTDVFVFAGSRILGCIVK